MATTLSLEQLEARYEAAAQEYLESLPLEHFMESIGQSTQKKITVESLELVSLRRPDFHVFSELLVQYKRPGKRRLGQVCPDNMVVLSEKPIRASLSYNLELEPAWPYWMLEYVSKSNPRKDYDYNVERYQKDLKIPYYLIFHPEKKHLLLYRRNGGKYALVKANKQGRYPIKELEIEVAVRDDWVRFWYQGKLLPLPAELQRDLDAAQGDLDAVRRRADELQRQLEEAEAARQSAERELAQLRAKVQTRNGRRGNGTKP